MATSAGQVQSTIKVKATAQNLDKVEAQVSKLMLASEKIRTQQAKTATQMAKAVAVQNKDAAAKQKAALQAEKLSLQNQKLSNSISNATNKQSLFNKVLNTGKILALGYTIKNLGNAFTSLIQGSADYIENLNLFNVVMGESTEKAENFINTMNDVLGLDTSKMMQYMGTFKGMANNMGIAEDAAYTMSEGLTKLTYDLSSFYNTSVDQAFTSLSSAITGQTKSIREQFKGIDVTMGTLQVDLDILGIDKTVSELSYAEKSILRYISILRQSQSAQGDFARTMTSPAQMMRQLTERVITLARAFGNIFIPILQAVLPYILAITSLLTKLFNTISAFVAKIFGFEMPEFDYSGITTGLGSASDDLDAVGDSASGASDKVKEFKKQLQGFDVLNVITSPTDTSDTGGAGGGGGGGAGMIDPALLEAIKNYDNRLDLASDKVKQLEAAIQSFLSKLNFEPLKKSLDNLWESMKLVGNFTWQGLKDFYNEFLVPVAQWTVGEGLPRFIDAIANGLAKIDWDNLNAKLKDLFQALAPFAIHVGEGLLWFFENVLVPLATWTISDVLPNFLSMLASALKILNSGIEVAAPLLSWLWDSFIAPIASFTGGAIVGVLESVANALEWIADNELASKVLGGVLTALTGIAAVKTASSLIETAGGLSKLVSNAIQAHSKTSALNKVLLTVGKTAKNSKGSIVLIGKDIKDLATNATGTVTVGTVLTTMLKNMGSTAKNIVGGITNLGKNVLTLGKNVATGNTSVKDLGKTLTGTLKNALSSVGSSMKTAGSNAKFMIDYYSQTASSATKLGVSLVGAAGLVGALKTTSNAMKEIATEGETTASSLGKVVGGLATAAASGAAIGASFGPLGALIGGVGGAFASLVSGINSYDEASRKIVKETDKKIKASKEYRDSLEEELKSLEKNTSSQLVLSDSHKTLVYELESIVDANGRVKQGYEDRAKYILGTLKEAYGIEYTMTDGQIDNYDTLIQKIKDTIEAKNAEVLADANREKYAKLLESETQLWVDKNKAVEEHKKVSEELETAQSDLADVEAQINALTKAGLPVTSDLREQKSNLKKEVDDLTESEKKWAKEEEEATEAYKQNILEQNAYSNLQAAIMTGDQEKIKQAVEDFTNSYTENGETNNLTLAQRIKKEQEAADIILKEYETKYGKDIPEEMRNSALASLNETVDGLMKQTKEVKDGKYSQELIDAWYELGNTNKDKFLEKFQELPADVQQKIIDKMYEKGYSISTELQEGIKAFNPEIKVGVNTAQAKTDIANFISKITGSVNSALNIVFGGNKANGGIFDNGSWKPVPRYATGGLPDVGSMFVAGEAGPEWVGDINGKTGVLNSGQLSNVFANALDNVMSRYMSGNQTLNATIPVYVGGDKVDEKQRQINLRNNNIYGTAR